MDKELTRLFQFPQVLQVEASAGSGKTYALARRYIQLLINPYSKPQDLPFDTILAITFTNKAALEMKERILDLLKKIALDRFEDPKEKEEFLSWLGVGEETAKAMAWRLMDGLIKNYNYFQVATIDSFINAILSACAFKLNLSATFRTEKEYKDYLMYSLDALIERASNEKNIARLFRDFLVHYLFIENNTAWFPRQSIVSVIESLFSKSNHYAADFMRSSVESKDVILLKKQILRLMGKLKDSLPASTHKAFSRTLSVFLESNREGFDVDNLSDFFKREELPVRKGEDSSSEAQNLWQRLKKSLQALCELESASAFNHYIDIFNGVLAGLRGLAAKDDVLFLEALNKEARHLFDEKSLTLPELYYRLAMRFKHFLIDEFQDTSILQWENLRPMIDEALATDGSLFIVGDKKQAIYRFRGGAVSLMDSARERFRGLNIIEEPLQMNRRSRVSIVEFNNLVFSEDNLKRFLGDKDKLGKGAMAIEAEHLDEITNVFKAATQQHLPHRLGGYVRSEFLDAKTREERDAQLKEKVYILLDDVRSRFPCRDIAFLARKNEEVELLTSWMLERGVAVESEKTLDVRQNSYIKELVSFLKFLNSPIDNLSFASFILGEIFTSTAGLGTKTVQDFIFASRDKTRQKFYLYRLFREQFPEAWDRLIEQFFKSVGFVPLYELTVSIFNTFGVMERFYEYQGFFMRFLELIKEKEEEHASISAFLEFFDKAPSEDLYVNVTESDAVKVLTIHKAKGLEFPVVIIPFLEMLVKIEPQLVVEDEGRLRLFHLKKKYTDFSRRLALLARQEYARSFIDELNSIYVALTRAADELYIFVSSRGERGFNLASLLLPDNSYEAGRRLSREKSVRKKEEPAVNIAASRYADWIRLLQNEFAQISTQESAALRLRGEVLHCILSFIGNLRGQDAGASLASAVKQAKTQYPFVDDFQELQATVSALLGGKELRRYFWVEESEVFTEKDVVDSSGNTRRIDRLIVSQDEVLVIDYKSTRTSTDEYRMQVGEYLRIVRDIYPTRACRGILIYLDDLSSEEVA